MKAAAALAAPYLAWVAFILAFEVAGALGVPVPRGWAAPAYALKSALCLALLVALKPWREEGARGTEPARQGGGIGAPGGRTLLWGISVGVAVFLLWVAPESPWLFGHCRALSLLYHRWFVTPLGAWPEYFDPEIFPALPAAASGLAFSPEEAGWPLAIARLFGSAFVIAAAEEYFFRGFLYRWIRGRNWRTTPLSDFDAQSFWIVVAVFACEHDRWFMGAVAGIAYGLLAVKAGTLRPAIVAHVTTNLLLGLYVLCQGRFGFW